MLFFVTHTKGLWVQNHGPAISLVLGNLNSPQLPGLFGIRLGLLTFLITKEHDIIVDYLFLFNSPAP